MPRKKKEKVKSSKEKQIGKTEEQIKTNETKYKSLFENMLNGFALHKIIINKKGKPIDYEFLEINHAFEKLTGLKKRKIIGKRVTSIIPGIKKDPTNLISTYGKVALTGKGIIFEIYFAPLKKHFSIHAYSPKKGFFVTIFEDITERKQAKEKFFTIVKKSPIPTAVGGSKGSIISFNEALEKLIGYKQHEIKNVQDWSKKLYPDKEYRKFVDKNIKKALTGKKQDCTIFEITCKNGSKKTVEFYTSFFEGGLIIQMVDITERKKVEEELNDIFRLSPDMIAVCSTEGKFLKVNPSWEKALGYNIKELLNLGWAKLVHPDDLETTNNEVKRQLKNQPIANFVNRFRCKNGSYKILEWQATAAHNNIVHATAHDITERNKTEEKLKKSEERFRNLVQNIPGMIYQGDKNWSTQIIFNSEAICGYTLEEFSSKKINWLDLIHPDDKQSIFKHGKKLTKKLIGLVQIYRIIDKNKKIKWVKDYKNSVFEEGKFKGVNGIVFDITEEKKSEEKYKVYIESSPDGIFVVNQFGKYVDVNHSVCNMLGYTKEELLKLSLQNTIPPEMLDKTLKIFEKLKKEGRISIEMKLLKKDKSTIQVSLDAVKLPDNKFLAFCKDIDDRKKIECELEDRHEKLENFYKISIGRELKMVELKKKIKELEAKFNIKPSQT